MSRCDAAPAGVTAPTDPDPTPTGAAEAFAHTRFRLPGFRLRDGASPPLTGEKRPQRAKTRVFIALIVGAIVVGALVARILVSSHTIGHKSLVTQGYTGSATNTNVLSAQWSKGVGAAWVLPDPRPGDIKADETTLFAEGSTLYMVSVSAVERAFSVAALDVSSSEPTVLWESEDSTVRVMTDARTFRVVSVGRWLAVGNILIDKTTGIQMEGPWENDQAMALVDDILVTCSGYETCSGWKENSSSWVLLWKSTTGMQSHRSIMWKWEGSRTIGTGEDTAILVPVDDERNLQIVNAYTGVVTTLGEEGRLDERVNYRTVYPATDGIVVEQRTNQLQAFDTAGNPTVSFQQKVLRKIPTEDGNMPTVSDIQGFFETGKTTWTTGSMEAGGKECETLTLRPTSGTAKYSVDGMVGVSSSFVPPCSFLPTHARASADGSAAFVQHSKYSKQNVYFFATMENKAYATEELTNANSLTWVYDDLLVGMTEEGLIAFTPASS